MLLHKWVGTWSRTKRDTPCASKVVILGMHWFLYITVADMGGTEVVQKWRKNFTLHSRNTVQRTDKNGKIRQDAQSYNNMLKFWHRAEKEKALLLSLFVKLKLTKLLPDSLVTLVNWRLLDRWNQVTEQAKVPETGVSTDLELPLEKASATWLPDASIMRFNCT